MKTGSNEKPKKIVINSTRKSLVIGKNSLTSPKSPVANKVSIPNNSNTDEENMFSSNYNK